MDEELLQMAIREVELGYDLPNEYARLLLMELEEARAAIHSFCEICHDSRPCDECCLKGHHEETGSE